MNYPLQSKPWYILGPGAMGCLWAHCLLQQTLDVRLIVHSPARLAQLRQTGGITIIDDRARDNALIDEPPPQPQSCPALLGATLNEPIEQLIISCKAQQSIDAFTPIASALVRGATVILFQNGMGIADQLLLLRPDLKLYCSITTSGAHMLSPFCVQRAGRGQTQLGRYPQANSSGMDHSQRLAHTLNSDQLPIGACANIYHAQWQKLTVNCVINPLTALFNIRNGLLLEHAEAAAQAKALCKEVAAVSQALGMPLEQSDLQASVVRVCQQTATNISSMLQDVRLQRSTEIDYINGYLQRMAQRNDVNCPVNDRVLARIRTMEAN
jgi:2-dehydropantoate 2-reductase